MLPVVNLKMSLAAPDTAELCHFAQVLLSRAGSRHVPGLCGCGAGCGTSSNQTRCTAESKSHMSCIAQQYMRIVSSSAARSAASSNEMCGVFCSSTRATKHQNCTPFKVHAVHFAAVHAQRVVVKPAGSGGGGGGGHAATGAPRRRHDPLQQVRVRARLRAFARDETSCKRLSRTCAQTVQETVSMHSMHSFALCKEACVKWE